MNCAGIPPGNFVNARTPMGKAPAPTPADKDIRTRIFVEVDAVREFERCFRATTPTVDDTVMDPVRWAALIANMTFTALSQSLTPIEVEKFRDSMVQVAALAFAAIESLDRQRERNGKAFYERAKQPPVTRETPPSYQEC